MLKNPHFPCPHHSQPIQLLQFPKTPHAVQRSHSTTATAKQSKGFLTFPLTVRVCSKGVVKRPHDFIHALDIGYARVQLGIDEQDPLHHLPVSFAAVGQNFVLAQRAGGGFQRGAHLENKAESGQPTGTDFSAPVPSLAFNTHRPPKRFGLFIPHKPRQATLGAHRQTSPDAGCP